MSSDPREVSHDLPDKNKFDPQFAIAERGDKPSQLFRDYMAKLDALVTAMPRQANTFLGQFANDAAAAAGGVAGRANTATDRSR
jgi:hypothetical protein